MYVSSVIFKFSTDIQSDQIRNVKVEVSISNYHGRQPLMLFPGRVKKYRVYHGPRHCSVCLLAATIMI